MPEADLVHEVAAFTLGVNEFLVPPRSIGEVGTDCQVFAGEIVSMMPHTHKLARNFTVDLDRDGKEERVLESGPYGLGSDIHVYAPQTTLKRVSSLRFECTFNTTTNHDVVYGIGENEMCILFGSIYPVRAHSWPSRITRAMRVSRCRSGSSGELLPGRVGVFALLLRQARRHLGGTSSGHTTPLPFSLTSA